MTASPQPEQLAKLFIGVRALVAAQRPHHEADETTVLSLEWRLAASHPLNIDGCCGNSVSQVK
jgi:hypothetical protein